MSWLHISAAEWQTDLAYLVDTLRRTHRNLFHTISPTAFYDAVRAFDTRIPSLASHEIVVGLARLLASVGDGHTYLSLDDVPAFRRYPLRLYQYSDGMHIQAVAPSHADSAGARVVAIADSPIADAYAAMRAVVSHDNEMGVQSAAPVLLTIPEVLHACEIIATSEQATYMVQLTSGAYQTYAFQPIDVLPNDMVDARDHSVPAPLWLQQPADRNWWTYLADTQTLYAQYNRVQNLPDLPVTTFCDQLFQRIAQGQVQRLVLDIRRNSGGNMALNHALIHQLIRCDTVNQWGKLFVIIGRGTFSAAMNLAVDLERHTRAVFVGEPTASRPNVYGENGIVVLPNCGLQCSISFLWWQYSAPYDDRAWIKPEVSARLSAADYAANRDPAIEAVLSYTLDPTHAIEYPDRLTKQLHRHDLLLSTSGVRTPRHQFG
ncbi:MAG TPA: hypothetical protein VF909_00900 [Roseiflexaceae bacterium]